MLIALFYGLLSQKHTKQSHWLADNRIQWKENVTWDAPNPLSSNKRTQLQNNYKGLSLQWLPSWFVFCKAGSSSTNSGDLCSGFHRKILHVVEARLGKTVLVAERGQVSSTSRRICVRSDYSRYTLPYAALKEQQYSTLLGAYISSKTL